MKKVAKKPLEKIIGTILRVSVILKNRILHNVGQKKMSRSFQKAFRLRRVKP
jgi:hypothetical protein